MKEISKKILPEYFEDVKSGIKTFEVRKDEDDIQVGDILMLEEWKPDGVLIGGYTGRCIRKRVKYVLRNIPQYGLQEGYCIIGLEDINNGWIPCSERLPEVNTRVMCFTENKTYVFAEYGGSDSHYLDNKDVWFSDRGWYRRDSIIAWQPLPEPYQQKNETVDRS